MNTDSLLAVSFEDAFEASQSNVISEMAPTQPTPSSSGPSSTLVFAGISYWTVLGVLAALVVILVVTKYILKYNFYKKNEKLKK